MSTTIPGPTSHIYFSQRLRLHYVNWGNEEAPPLLLVHGGRDHCRNWDWVAERLRDDYHITAPDLRGHGDSQWIEGGTYTTSDYVYDIAQLIHQLELAPLTIISHSMGGGIALRYAGLYPDTVKKLVVMEGLGPSPEMMKKHEDRKIDEGLRGWIDQLRKLSGRVVRRYATLEQAIDRMQEANPHLSFDQARHLTVHGVNRNEDGTYSWKFDNYIRAFPSTGLKPDETAYILGQITCPVLLLRGSESWASDPVKDGRVKQFQNARSINIDNAGHWLHHDQLEKFLEITQNFLAD